MKRLLGSIAVLAGAFAFAQQPYLETLEVRLHNLDIVVTDAKGNAVRGLTRDDFIVLEDGAPQTITNFSIYDSSTTRVVSKETPTATSAEAVNAEPPPPRRVVFFVDDMEVQSPTRRKLVKTASSFVDQLRQGDLAAVIRPTGLERVAQSYTTDLGAVRTKLVEAIESCKVTGDSPGAGEIRRMRGQLENASHALESKFAKAEYATRSRERSRQRLAQIRALIGSMAGIEGRKILVLIVYGIPSRPGTDAFTQLELIGGADVDRMTTDWSQLTDLESEIDELGRTAAANGVTIYAMEPEQPFGLFEMRTGASRPSGSTYGPQGGHASVQQSIGMEHLYSRLALQAQTLDSLTEKTGGKWFRGTETMDDLFRQVASDLSVYYSLAYRATGKRDKPRRIEVRVRNRPELRVRTRSEVIDKSPEREMADLTVANLLFPRDVNELRISVSKGALTRQGKAYTVPLDIVIPLEKLTFLVRNDGKYAATIDIHYAAAGHYNDYTTSGRHQQHIEITEEQYAQRGGITYRFKTGIQLPEGPSKVALGVFDATSRLAGFATLDVDAR
ncbi:MAG TPA: VWA domain-containing protein [Thermoanaerobaculia bacterium]|nr:VWA domain-containing protein [Thermoanaerobaculia bacterium]